MFLTFGKDYSPPFDIKISTAISIGDSSAQRIEIGAQGESLKRDF